jgi:hypothetical protein
MPSTLLPPLEYVCFLSKGTKETKGKAVHTFGILARVYNPDFDTCCTVMLVDGSLVVYGYKEVDLGLKRLNNKNAYCPLKTNTPTEELARLLKARKNENPSLQEVIIDMERLYEEHQQVLACNAAKEPKEPKLNAKPQTTRKKRKAKSKPKAPPPQKRTRKPILIGTDIAGFYYDMEMLPHDEKDGTEIPLVGNGPGKWYRGKVIAEKWTEQNKLMYECRFNTPLQHIHWYTETYAEKAAAYFHTKKVAQGWRCETETRPTVPKDLVVGDFITRWFPTHELPKQFVDAEGCRGAYVDAIVLEVLTNKGKNTYKCAFDAPVSCELTYGETETKNYRMRYLDRRAPVLQDAVVKRSEQNTLCKGALQRASVAESCAVISRVQHQPKILIKGTQDDAQDVEVREKIDTVVTARAFMEFISVATHEDVQEPSDMEEDVISVTSPSPTPEETVTTPQALYTREQKHLRVRLFPCKVCGDPASGAHQCGSCFAHVHVICASPYPGSPEGYGQLVLCGKCTGKTNANVPVVGGSKTRTTKKLSLTVNRERKHTKTEAAILTTTNALTPPPPPPGIARNAEVSAGENTKSLEAQPGQDYG